MTRDETLEVTRIALVTSYGRVPVLAMAHAAQKPIMIYDNPITYRVDRKPEHMMELADCESIAAINARRVHTRRITDLRHLLGDRYPLFLGVDDLAFEGLTPGCDGLPAGVGCAFARETVAWHDLFKAAKHAQALALYLWMTPMLDLHVSTKLVQNLKLLDLPVGVRTALMRSLRLPLLGDARVVVEKRVTKALATRPTQYQPVP